MLTFAYPTIAQPAYLIGPVLLQSFQVQGQTVIVPEAGLTLYALDRNEALFAMDGLNATETLRALDRNEALHPLEATDG